MDLPFHLLNVFSIAGEPFSGNPLCVFPEASRLNEEEMQAWTRQFNLSESTFVLGRGEGKDLGEADVRIFTPGHEMPFAGHPTLGTAEVVAALGGGLDAVHLSMPAGRIPVERIDGGWRLAAQAARLRQVESTGAELAACLGLDEGHVVPADAAWVDAGVEQLLVRVTDVEALRSCDPVGRLMHEHMTSPPRAPHVYAWAWTGSATIEARLFFTQGQAVLEDPATGSACANLGGWLVARGARDVSVVVSQGSAVARPSRLLLDIDADGAVHVGGRVERVGNGTCSLGRERA
jgi:trans-2,3-dihydro-3-hydroxyanthranilate isomerase